MGNTRQTKQRSEKTLLDDIVEAGIITGGLVIPYSVLGYLIQNAQTRTGSNPSMFNMPRFSQAFSTACMAATAANAKKILPYVGWCAQRGMLRNTTYLQHRRWDEPLKTEKSEKVESVKENPSLELDLVFDLTGTSGIAGLIAGLNIVLMQRSKNFSTWHAHRLKNPTFQIPLPQFKVSTMGATATWIGDFAFLFGLLTVPYAKSALKSAFPDHPEAAERGAFVASVGVSSFFSNLFGGILYNNQMIRFCPQTMTVPPLRKVASDLLSREVGFMNKMRVSTFGLALQLVTTGFTFRVLPWMQIRAENIAPWIISSMFGRSATQSKEPAATHSNEQQKKDEAEALRGCSP